MNEGVGLEFVKVLECRLTCESVGKYRFVYDINVHLSAKFITFITFIIRINWYLSCIIYVIIIKLANLFFVMAENREQVEFSDGDADRIAEAVITLRNSGLFSVEPIEHPDNPFSIKFDISRSGASRQYEMTPTPREFNSVLLPPQTFCLPPRNSTPRESNSEQNRTRTYRVESTPKPKPANVDDSQLFSRPPRISNFSGAVSKGEVSFEAWKYEVKCLMKDNIYHRDLLLQSVRQSLKGEASRLAMHLGENATLDNILQKLETVYGIVESGMTLLQQFYNAQQEIQEPVAEYGCRLEDIINKAIQRGAVARHQVDEMLRNKLWSGLRDGSMKSSTRYKYETVKDFDTLVAELRAVEQEMKELERLPVKGTKPQKAIFMHQSDKTVDDLTKKVQELEVKMKDQAENNKLLNKILEKIEILEKKQHGKEPTRTSNYSRPLPRDRQ